MRLPGLVNRFPAAVGQKARVSKNCNAVNNLNMAATQQRTKASGIRIAQAFRHNRFNKFKLADRLPAHEYGVCLLHRVGWGGMGWEWGGGGAILTFMSISRHSVARRYDTPRWYLHAHLILHFAAIWKCVCVCVCSSGDGRWEATIFLRKLPKSCRSYDKKRVSSIWLVDSFWKLAKSPSSHKKMVVLMVRLNGECLPWTTTGYLQPLNSRSVPMCYIAHFYWPKHLHNQSLKVPKGLLTIFKISHMDCTKDITRQTPFPPCFRILFFDVSCSGTKSAGKRRPLHIPDGLSQIGQLMSSKRTWCQKWAMSTIYFLVFC